MRRQNVFGGLASDPAGIAQRQLRPRRLTVRLSGQGRVCSRHDPYSRDADGLWPYFIRRGG
jgi:hypothetical protein